MKEKDLPLVFELGPTTWRLLITLLSLRRPTGPRELAKRMQLSSHTVALYHLGRLQEHDIVEKTLDGDYQVREDADLGFLDNFLYLQYRILPRTMVYAVFVTGLLIFYTLFTAFDFSVHNVFALVLGVSGSVFLWAETYRIQRGLV
ncbi:MAG: hypothetical protein ACFFEA_13920 [Candidatus Thorarchaeota archaeon]